MRVLREQIPDNLYTICLYRYFQIVFTTELILLVRRFRLPRTLDLFTYNIGIFFGVPIYTYTRRTKINN